MFRATNTPPLSYLLDDLLTRDLAAIAGHLGISVATLRRYKQAGQAPRAVLLALFYETRWGYSLMETTAHNGRMYAEQETRFARVQIEHLKAQITRLESLGDFGAANAPLLGVR
jgi:predicted site-specific integrase-resolvase